MINLPCIDNLILRIVIGKIDINIFLIFWLLLHMKFEYFLNFNYDLIYKNFPYK